MAGLSHRPRSVLLALVVFRMVTCLIAPLKGAHPLQGRGDNPVGGGDRVHRRSRLAQCASLGPQTVRR